MPTQGCDSRYSWHPEYKDTVIELTVEELLEKILSLLPGKTWINPRTGLRPVLCFTGGEPTLQQKFIGKFIDSLFKENSRLGIDKILIETNCSIPLSDAFLMAISLWLSGDYDNKIIWANSPKLSNSGEPSDKAIRPDILVAQYVERVTDWFALYETSQLSQYVKFVSDGTDESFNEIQKTVNIFNEALKDIDRELPPYRVFIMPEGATKEQQEQIQAIVAEKCLGLGYIFCARVHVFLYGNTKGT